MECDEREVIDASSFRRYLTYDDGFLKFVPAGLKLL